MSAQLSSARVGVCVSGDRDDAYRVFDVLKAAFPATNAGVREKATVSPPDAAAHGPTVWSIVVEASGRGTAEGPVGLDEPIAVDLYGTGPELRWVRDVLESAFGIDSEQHVSGEHEMEVRLRLSPTVTR
ncbi:hypothetical protein [Streptomyces sp. XD-27]|uniref:hypothetical protein n=1 Tax=Streptomyces sp. XD-27 TaxID=3062779 RepID=UPI0026F46183|nr:hypothetical protein [Streptomyces sp. XD-27]WKX68928.1 hypothetical protein Q3Y56_02445 [Streptomyces sp. XD-27]